MRRNGSIREMAGGRSLGHSSSGVLRIGGGYYSNICFAVLALAVVVVTVLAATYQPDDPLLHPPASASELTSFLTSTSNATFAPDASVLRTGEDFTDSSSAPFIDFSDLNSTAPGAIVAACDPAAQLDCTDPEIFHLLMRSAIEALPELHFYRFGKPVAVPNETDSCDMAWRFRPKDSTRPQFYKDFRRFHLSRSSNCALSVSKVDGFHSGVNARKRHRPNPDLFETKKSDDTTKAATQVVGEPVNDTLPVIDSESTFAAGRYLIYLGGGDRCKSMNHYLWSLLCALGEAKYLNRTLVMDLRICLSSMYTKTGMDEDDKDFRFYFDFEHLQSSASVIDQANFWTAWGNWREKDKLSHYYVNDVNVTPMKLAEVNDALIMRKFGDVEPDNYWYRVCEGDSESVIQRPWHLLWKSPRLMEIVSAVASRMNWDFDSVHIVRGEKAKNTELWPRLAADTSPEALLVTLRDKIEEGRHLYIATNEPDTSFFEPLREAYSTYSLDDFKDMWDENSDWYLETKDLNNGVAVEFDGYMRIEVDTEVFLRGKKQLETFNDLTNDCKDGVHTCSTSS